MFVLLSAISDKLTDPSSFTDMVGRLGLGITIAFLSFVAALALGGLIAWRAFGKNGWIDRIMTRWGDHLDRSEKIQSAQWSLCTQVHRPGGTANLADFRDAGHDLMDVLQEIGNGVRPETGAAIKPKIDKIHEKLRQSPPPLPVLDLSQQASQ